jgi:hypothetical protein
MCNLIGCRVSPRDLNMPAGLANLRNNEFHFLFVFFLLFCFFFFFFNEMRRK